MGDASEEEEEGLRMVQTEPLSGVMKRRSKETEKDKEEEEIGPQSEPSTPLQGNGSAQCLF